MIGYIMDQWVISPNPGWYKGYALALGILGLAWIILLVIRTVAAYVRLCKLERLQKETRAEYDALIKKRREYAKNERSVT